MIDRIDYDSVAELRDRYVDTDYDQAFFVREIMHVGLQVLELTSGTGRLSLPLLEAGADLTCVDMSQGMLKILSEKLKMRNLSAQVVCADVCEINFHEEFELAIFPVQSFMELVGEDKQRIALAAIFRALKPGGKFICTLHNPIARGKLVDGMLRIVDQFQKEEGTLIVSGFEQGSNSIVTRHQFFEYFNAAGVMERKRLLHMQFEFVEKEMFQVMAEQTGFKVLELYGNDDRSAFDPTQSPVMIWMLEKQAF